MYLKKFMQSDLRISISTKIVSSEEEALNMTLFYSSVLAIDLVVCRAK